MVNSISGVNNFIQSKNSIDVENILQKAKPMQQTKSGNYGITYNKAADTLYLSIKGMKDGACFHIKNDGSVVKTNGWGGALPLLEKGSIPQKLISEIKNKYFSTPVSFNGWSFN